MEIRVVVNRILIVWLLAIILVAIFGKISVAQSDGGRTAADFLKIDLGARATGMGGAYTAVSDGAASTYWNPAGLTYLKKNEISLGHFDWYQDMTVEYGSFAFRVNPKVTLATSIIYLNYGVIDRYDNSGVSIGEIDVYDWAGLFSVGYTINENWSLGFTGKYINQKLDDLSGSALASDFGVRYNSPQISVGAFLGNIGTKMKFESVAEKLPATGRLGVTYIPENDKFLTSFEIEKQFLGNMKIKQGLEVNFSHQYFLRSGFTYYPGLDNYSFSDGLSFGGGIIYSWAKLDYSFSPSGKYAQDDIHRFTLVFQLNH